MQVSQALIIESEQEVLKSLIKSMNGWYRGDIVTTSNGAEGARKIGSEDFDIVITCLFPQKASLSHIIKTVRQKVPPPVVIVIGTTDCQDLVDGIHRAGCFFYPRPENYFVLRSLVEHARTRAGRAQVVTV